MSDPTVADLIAYLTDNVDPNLPLTDDAEGWAKVPARVQAWNDVRHAIPVSTAVPPSGADLLHDRIRCLCDELHRKSAAQYPATASTFAIDADFHGRRFIRIVSVDSHGSNRGVHAFVERQTGDLIKAATWKAPQKDKAGLAVRGNLLDDFDYARILRECDPYGGYLYMR